MRVFHVSFDLFLTHLCCGLPLGARGAFFAMPTNCASCEAVILSDYARCGECSRKFHFECSINEVVYRKKINNKQPWRCSACLKRPTIRRLDSDDGGSMMDNVSWKAELAAELSKLLAPINSHLDELKQDVSVVKQFAQHMSDGYDSFLLEIKELRSQLADTKREQLHMKACLATKDAEINTLSDKLNQLEQYQRNRNIILNGVPCTQGEDCKTIVCNIARKLNVDLDPRDLDVAHRLRTVKKSTAPPIVAQFTSRNVRDCLLAKKKLILTEGGFRGMKVGDAVYLNEHLSNYNNRLLTLTKNLARQYGFKFAWFRDGRVLVREDTGCRPFVILSEDDARKKLERSPGATSAVSEVKSAPSVSQDGSVPAS